MVNEFIAQEYLIIENNVVVNNVVWNGDTSQWTPPQGSIALVKATTSAMVWAFDKNLVPPDFVLQEQTGAGGIGFTWDGSVLTTNQPKPTPVTPEINQPTTSGTVTI